MAKESIALITASVNPTQGSVFVTNALLATSVKFKFWDAKTVAPPSVCVPRCAVGTDIVTQILENVSALRASQGPTVVATNVLEIAVGMENVMQLGQAVCATSCGMVQIALKDNARLTASKPMVSV